AAVPLFVRNDTSDANNVPCLFFLFAAAMLLDEYLEARARFAIAGAVVLAALAAIGRPEMPLLVGAVLAAMVWSAGRRPRGSSESAGTFSKIDRGLLVGAGAWLVLIAPHLLGVRRQIAGLESRASLPGLHRGLAE